MSKTPTLASFRRIVVKVSVLLVDAAAGGLKCISPGRQWPVFLALSQSDQ